MNVCPVFLKLRSTVCNHLQHRFRLHLFFCLTAALLSVFFAHAARAEDEEEERQRRLPISTMVLYMENDLFYNTDKYYTSAVQIRAISPPLRALSDNKILPDALDGLMDSAEKMQHRDTQQYNVSVGFGQTIYTPKDTDARELQERDRPYAGYLYGFLALHAKQQLMMDTYELTLGIVGPSAVGEAAQNEVHRFRGLDTARGWRNQLRDEPVMMLTWSRNYRLNPSATETGWGWDALPFHSLSAGNVLTQAAVGGELRYGWNLPASFGTPLIRPGSSIEAPTGESAAQRAKNRPWGWYFFAGLEGNAVAHNIFLDGNTWRDSHSVTKEVLVGSANAGLAVTYQGMSLAYNHVYRTKEFKNQSREQNYGSITLTIPF